MEPYYKNNMIGSLANMSRNNFNKLLVGSGLDELTHNLLNTSLEDTRRYIDSFIERYEEETKGTKEIILDNLEDAIKYILKVSGNSTTKDVFFKGETHVSSEWRKVEEYKDTKDQRFALGSADPDFQVLEILREIHKNINNNTLQNMYSIQGKAEKAYTKFKSETKDILEFSSEMETNEEAVEEALEELYDDVMDGNEISKEITEALKELRNDLYKIENPELPKTVSNIKMLSEEIVTTNFILKEKNEKRFYKLVGEAQTKVENGEPLEDAGMTEIVDLLEGLLENGTIDDDNILETAEMVNNIFKKDRESKEQPKQNSTLAEGIKNASAITGGDLKEEAKRGMNNTQQRHSSTQKM